MRGCGFQKTCLDCLFQGDVTSGRVQSLPGAGWNTPGIESEFRKPVRVLACRSGNDVPARNTAFLRVMNLRAFPVYPSA